MSNFLEDPRLRQRWNQISHNAETVTENAAVGFWNLQHHYINPCLSAVSGAVESCTAVCLGDPEERARRRRERDRTAEYSFDFYDDWYADDESGGILGGWSNEDWDRLLAGTGTGSSRRHGPGEIAEQPKRKRGMSYGTRGVRRKPAAEQDPTIIPSTQPIGFLGKLPWKIGGTLRYKPSAADLQEHPGRHEHMGMGETEPLLDHDDDTDDDFFSSVAAGRRQPGHRRKRSGTTGSGDTSDSYRSRGDLFPSDEEGEEDAVPLDDEEFNIALDKVVDDRGSNKTRSSSGKGKRPAAGGADGRAMSRTVSRTTIGSTQTRDSLRGRRSSQSMRHPPSGVAPEVVVTTASPTVMTAAPSVEDLVQEEREAKRIEDEEVQRKRRAAAALAAERGLAGEEGSWEGEAAMIEEDKPDVGPDVDGADDMVHDERPVTTELHQTGQSIGPPLDLDDDDDDDDGGEDARPLSPPLTAGNQDPEEEEFIPARLPHFR